jgi:hypothetical protein
MIRIGAMAALDLGFHLYALPHNLESIATWSETDQICRMSGIGHFDWERRLLARMSGVLCISKEEAWLLQNIGIRAGYYPYWPDSGMREELIAIREQRAKQEHSGSVVILGSAINAPTEAGMRRLIEHLQKNSNGKYVIAGHGVMRLSNHCRSEKFDLRDGITDDDLAKLLMTAPAVCIHQDSGAGALTRIRNLLIAGVPVVCNEIAARDYFGDEGVFVYSHLDQIVLMIDVASACRIGIPVQGAERTLQSLLSGGKLTTRCEFQLI